MAQPQKQRYDQHIQPPKRKQQDDEFFQRRLSQITENTTVQRRGSQMNYMSRRNMALKQQNNKTEQDAAVLAAMQEEHMAADDWSSGAKYRVPNVSIGSKVDVAMSNNPKKKKRQFKTRPPPKPPISKKNKNIHKQSDNSSQFSGASSDNLNVGGSIISSDVTGSVSDIDRRNQPKLSAGTVSSSGAFSQFMDEDIYTEIEFVKYKPSICLHLLVFIIITIVSAGAFYYGYLWEWPDGIYYKMSYAALFWAFWTLLLLLNICNKYHQFHEFFGSMCNHRGPIIFIILTIIFGLIEYILYSLQQEELLVTEDELGANKFQILLIIIDIVYYLTIFFFFCAFMSNWPTISYYCSESSWIQAFLYMTVVGYLLIYLCRKLRPPNDKTDIISWYKKRDSYKITVEIINITCFLFFVLIVLFAGIVPIFGESVRHVSALGTWYAIGLYIILSFVVMLTPLLPGSIIDIAGGFLFVFVLVDNESFGFWESWIIAIFSVIILHYLGACAQWFIGKTRFVQFYLNTVFPAELLAASDAVLEEANCVTAGIIGYVFFDTGNGLNQGRINMKFWTQFCSEWSNIPNSFAVVSLGATIAIPALYPHATSSSEDGDTFSSTETPIEDQAAIYIVSLFGVMIPLLALIAALIQFTGLTIGVRTLGKSVDTDEYMMAREKWNAIKFFYKVSGCIPTKEGWKNDVLQLSTKNRSYKQEYQRCLYDDIMPLQRWYVNALHNKRIKQQKEMNKDHSERKYLSSSKLKLLILEKYRNDLNLIRNLHYTTIEAQYDDLIHDKHWLIDPNTGMDDHNDDMDENRYFSKHNVNKFTNRRILQFVLLVVLVLTFWISIYRIWWSSEIYDRVAKGIKIFEETTKWYDWIAFCVFIITFIIYFHYEIKLSLKNSGKRLIFCLKCCKINKKIESRFDTPFFDCSKFDDEFMEKLPQEHYKSISSMPPNINVNTPSNDDPDDDIHEVGFS